jgi:hypothetical protein
MKTILTTRADGCLVLPVGFLGATWLSLGGAGRDANRYLGENASPCVALGAARAAHANQLTIAVLRGDIEGAGHTREEAVACGTAS